MTKPPEFRSDFVVKLVDSMGSDTQIANVARVSTGTYTENPQKNTGLLNMLMRDRHGSPWESGILQFYIEAPIFVTREFFRHRIASYNEASSRYKEMEPIFYCPTGARPLQQVGKPGAYTFTQGSEEQLTTVRLAHKTLAMDAWDQYTNMLDDGIAREVARNVLPLSLYSSFYVTLNLRSLMNFLSLRRVTSETTVPTFPLYEIDVVASQMEEHAADIFPVAMGLFNEHGRVSP